MSLREIFMILGLALVLFVFSTISIFRFASFFTPEEQITSIGSDYFFIFGLLFLLLLFLSYLLFIKVRPIVIKEKNNGQNNIESEPEEETQEVLEKIERSSNLVLTDSLDSENEVFTLGSLYLNQRKYLGMVRRPGECVNILVVGGVGSGKTTAVIERMIAYSLKHGHSPIVYDTKGALYRKTAGLALKNGYTIKVLDTRNFANSLGFDLFEGIETEDDVEKTVESICDALAPGKSDFWIKAAELILKALILAVVEEQIAEERKGKDLSGQPPENGIGKFGRIFEILDSPTEGDLLKRLDRYFNRLGKRNRNSKAVKAYNSFRVSKDNKDGTDATLLRELLIYLNTLSSKSVKRILGSNDISVKDLLDSKTIVYVNIDDMSRLSSIITSLFFKKINRDLYRVAENKYHGMLEIPVDNIFDEFGVVGNIRGIEKIISTSRSYNISFTCALQSIGQLLDNYGKYGTETLDAGFSIYLIPGMIKGVTVEKMVEMGKPKFEIMRSVSFTEEEPENKRITESIVEKTDINRADLMSMKKDQMYLFSQSGNFLIDKVKSYELTEFNAVSEFEISEYMSDRKRFDKIREYFKEGKIPQKAYSRISTFPYNSGRLVEARIKY